MMNMAIQFYSIKKDINIGHLNICKVFLGIGIDVIKESACLVLNQITVDHFAYLFHCTPVGRDSDSMMAPT